MDVEIIGMGVPPPAEELNERNAGLDHPTRGQRLLPKKCVAVAVQNLLWFLGDVEDRIAGHQTSNPAIGCAMTLEYGIALASDQEFLTELVTE